MQPYSPSRRTALVLTGTGAHGAYHAGVLRALQEAGVKIDVIAGHGVGAGSAALAAIDGATRLWDPQGIWRSTRARASYTRGGCHCESPPGSVSFSRPSFSHRWSSYSPACSSISSGSSSRCCSSRPAARWSSGYSAWLQAAFAGENLPTSVPRLAVVAFTVILFVLAIGGVLAGRTIGSRRAERGWWWRIVAAPFDAHTACDRFVEADLGVDSWSRSSRTTI